MFNDDNMENDDTTKVLFKTSQNGIKIQKCQRDQRAKMMLACSKCDQFKNDISTQLQCAMHSKPFVRAISIPFNTLWMRGRSVLTTHSIFQIKTNKLHKRDDRPKIKQRNLSKNVRSLEMQTPRAIRVTHSYNKYSAIFECQAFCRRAKRAHSVLLNSLVVFGKFFIFIFGT